MFLELFNLFFTWWEEKFGGVFFLRKNTTLILYSNWVEKFSGWCSTNRFLLDKKTLGTMFFWEKCQVSDFAPVLPEKLVWCSPNSFSPDEKTFFRRPFSWKETQLFFMLKSCSKNFDWCSPKNLNCFRFDSQNTSGRTFPEKKYNFEL